MKQTQQANPLKSAFLRAPAFLFAYLLISFTPLFSEGTFDPSSVRSSDCKPGVFNCGYLPTPKEIQDSIPLKRDFNNFDELPSKADLSSKMPPVGSQGQQNSCVAWATGYAIKSYLATGGKSSKYDPPFKGGKGDNVFSPAFIYNQQNGGKDAGLYYYKTLEFLQANGVVPWSSMPYSDKDYRTQPNESAKKEALNYKIRSFSRLNFKNPDEIKRVLAGGNVVLFGIIIDDGFYKLKGSEVYDSNSGQSYGGHAMTIVGYDDSKTSKSGKKGAFKIQNSWGEDWGDKGFGWISYAMLAKVGQETYALIDNPKTTIQEQPTVVSPVIKPLSPPMDIKASRGEFDSMIVLTWLASDSAVSYLIQRKDSGESKYTDLAYSNLPTFADSNVSPDSTYIYRIISISSEERSSPSKDVEGFTAAVPNNQGKLGKVVGLTAKAYLANGSPKVSLSWSAIEGANGYWVSRIENTRKWKTIGKVKSTGFIDPSPVVEKTNSYRVSATVNGSKVGDWSDSLGVDVANTEVTPSQVTDLTASAGEYSDRIKLSWNSAPGATTYFIYRFNEAGDPSGPFDTEKASYEDGDPQIRDGASFAYTVIAANNTGYAEPSEFAFGHIDPELSKRSAGAILPPPENVTAEINQKEKKVLLKWNPVKDSNEYYIYRKQVNSNSKGKNSDFQFLIQVSGKLTKFSENFPGSPGDLFLYSVRSKSEFGSESKDSNAVSVFLNKEPGLVKKRALSLDEIPKTFLGNWSGLYWDPKLGPQNLSLAITGSNQDFTAILKVNDKVTKQYGGKWTPGSTGLKTSGFQFDLAREMEESSIVRLNSVGDQSEEMEYGFSKD
ncbi:C1 family peptidase [Leptospira ilyithenensis]|uniref:Cysteine protease n=1 Tax=Leptospira ilyithenensis TaxID=2484901 RepID=A0A4R9LWS8_9LEPT|nr:C1 family peptidase [Leptospira ilyithenensis]TGN14602.1 cysteine protease [Leptospira ilyithenensis]